jgi:hypothetical protein
VHPPSRNSHSGSLSMSNTGDAILLEYFGHDHEFFGHDHD